MTQDELTLFWHSYKYFEYEKELAIRELNHIAAPYSIVNNKNEKSLRIRSDVRNDQLERLVYFDRFQKGEENHLTLQGKLERCCAVTGKAKRQSTRYSAHCLHEYKGKFNPQIVRVILNILDVSNDQTVLDPFCGSGTTLLECSHGGINSVGTDLNPLAVLVANQKQHLLIKPPGFFQIQIEKCLLFYELEKPVIDENYWTATDLDYLLKWFEYDYLVDFDRLRRAIAKCDREARSFLPRQAYKFNIFIYLSFLSLSYQ